MRRPCPVHGLWQLQRLGAQPLCTPSRRHGDRWPAGAHRVECAPLALREPGLPEDHFRRAGRRTHGVLPAPRPVAAGPGRDGGILPAGQGGARLPGLLNAPLSRTGVLLKLMRVPLPAIVTPRVPGVDFALYAEVYGTLPVDGDTRLLGDAENADGSGTEGADHREQDRPTGVVPVGRLPARCRGRRQGAEAQSVELHAEVWVGFACVGVDAGLPPSSFLAPVDEVRTGRPQRDASLSGHSSKPLVNRRRRNSAIPQS